MSWNDFESKLKDSHFSITDDQMRNLKTSCADMYSILKFIFDSPRKLAKEYSSYTAAKFKRERRYQTPELFYNFQDDEVKILVTLRRKKMYSLAVSGFDYQKILKSPLVRYEVTYTQGLIMFGLWSRNEFTSCLAAWKQCVYDYINHKYNYVSMFED